MMIQDARIAVVMGGKSSEHEISVRSGKKVMESIQDRNPIAVLIGTDGRWTIEGQTHPSLGQAIDALTARADVAFLALHGENGEDGTIQGLLEMAGLPYTGSGVAGSALAMDKVRAKLVYRSRGLPTADFEAVTRRKWAREREEVLLSVERLGHPVVVKPACAGSSVGVSFPKDSVAFAAAVDALFQRAAVELIVAEVFLAGREFTCGVLSVDREARSFALPVTEIIPEAKFAFFDYEAKYTPGATREITPAAIPDPLRDRIQALALEAHEWLGCRDFSRTDLKLDDHGEPILLETNTIPGLTAQSLLPQAAAVAGYPFRRVVEILLENALLRRASA